MFEISWSELLILAVVTLLFVGPKELPRFLSTIGRYAGVMRRHANEFRKVFDQAMREAELDQMKREMESVRNDLAGTMRQAQESAASASRSTPGAAPAAAASPEPPFQTREPHQGAVAGPSAAPPEETRRGETMTPVEREPAKPEGAA